MTMVSSYKAEHARPGCHCLPTTMLCNYLRKSNMQERKY